ncbi:MAG: damage-inducible protein DinB, partial [Gemmatimonadetes bacterium]|nr:damage-inducible protein DinB [Gemmatimonadota bacterium]
GTRSDEWWEELVDFFEVKRSRAWIIVRRIAHTAHHRGQQTTLARMVGRDLHSTYGPTADTGGLMQNRAPVIYPYADLETLVREESAGRNKAPLPGPGSNPPTDRP